MAFGKNKKCEKKGGQARFYYKALLTLRYVGGGLFFFRKVA
jgi:hypothetical protein